jgi:hypothetical protein
MTAQDNLEYLEARSIGFGFGFLAAVNVPVDMLAAINMKI